MKERIEKAYESRPRRWIFEAAIAAVVLLLLIWSGAGVETSRGRRKTAAGSR